MQFKALELCDKFELESYFKACLIEVSDLSFTNLFLWHFGREISWSIQDECLIIMTKYPNSNPFIFYPLHKNNDLTAIKSALQACICHFESIKMPFSMHSLTQNQILECENLMPERFNFIYNEDRSDYVYSVSELIALAGKKYHKKKTHFNNFLKQYNFTFELLNNHNAQELASVYSKWFEALSDKSDGLKNEYIGILACLENFNELSFSGGIIRIDGEIAAFSFAEPLNPQCVVIHIEKADINYNGIYQAINREFLARCWANYELVNREEDLGIPGLRKAKQSYQPLFLQKKFEASLKI